MSDLSVTKALRSTAKLVVVEAPAGCGKTFQGAEYAHDVSDKIGHGRILILTHTHAACDVFAKRTSKQHGRVDARTIDSLVAQIASAYHKTIEVSADAGSWARSRNDGFAELATRVANLLDKTPMIAHSLAQRYPIIICDEHQDASLAQHALVMACLDAGASVRIFGDPMQRIYGSRKKAVMQADEQRWEDLKQKADVFDMLDTPHRWTNGSASLGQWILGARTALRQGNPVDLRGSLPQGLTTIVAENQARNRTGYQLAPMDGKPIYAFAKSSHSLLVLASQNETVNSLHSFFGRRCPIWEGYMRDNLSNLVDASNRHKGNAEKLLQCVISFLNNVSTGFTASAFTNTLAKEVSQGCVARRKGKPATLQALGRIIINEPNHKGVAQLLRRLDELRASESAFGTVKINYHHEFWDAIKMGEYDDPCNALAEMHRRRSYIRPAPPMKAISTVHKAKGLECDDVLVMPCDAKHYADSVNARCRLYVAMSRARQSLALVVSRQNPSPLFIL